MIGVTKYSLGKEVSEAIAEAKNLFGKGKLSRYEGRELISATAGRRGAYFVYHQVGQARPGAASIAGRRRIVLLIQSGRVEEIYFSDDHFRPGSWKRVID